MKMKFDDIKTLLPEIYQRVLSDSKPLQALLYVMQGMFLPSEKILDNINTYFGAYTAPDMFIYYLAKWVDLDRYLSTNNHNYTEGSGAAQINLEVGRLRELIAKAARISQWRGTTQGLKLFLETATGLKGFVLDENSVDADGVARAYHISIRAPKSALHYQKLIDRIVKNEKPAYVTYELTYAES